MAVNTQSDQSRERLPIVPYSGHCGRALSFFDLDEVFFALGRTTPWAEDETTNDQFVPPEPDDMAKELDELIGMKAATRKLLVMPDDNGDIEYRDSRWKYVTKEEAIANNCRWVLIETTIYYDELPTTDYRQIGVFSRVQRAEGVDPTKQVLLPAEIASCGIMEVLDNRHVVTRQPDVKDVYQLIIEF